MTASADIVLDSRLDTEFLADGGQRHTLFRSDRASGQRHIQYAETWKTSKKLGEGGFGKVWLQENDSGAVRALKEIRKDKGSASINYRRELEAAFKFSHGRYVHCFVESYGWFETTTRVYISMEYLPLGDLRHALGDSTLPEEQVQLICCQVVEGLQLMHSNNFVHRDLKPANILVVKPGPAWWVKLGDFGISKRSSEGTAFRTAIGTMGYLAPEIPIVHESGMDDKSLRKSYTSAVDMWALGEIVFRLLTRCSAFPSQRDLSLFVAKQQPLNLQPLVEKGVTIVGQDFIEKLLVAEPDERSSASVARAHGWLDIKQPAVIRADSQAQKENRVSMLNKYTKLLGSMGGTKVPEPTATWSTRFPGEAHVSSPAGTRFESNFDMALQKWAAESKLPKPPQEAPRRLEEPSALEQWQASADRRMPSQRPPRRLEEMSAIEQWQASADRRKSGQEKQSSQKSSWPGSYLTPAVLPQTSHSADNLLGPNASVLGLKPDGATDWLQRIAERRDGRDQRLKPVNEPKHFKSTDNLFWPGLSRSLTKPAQLPTPPRSTDDAEGPSWSPGTKPRSQASSQALGKSLDTRPSPAISNPTWEVIASLHKMGVNEPKQTMPTPPEKGERPSKDARLEDNIMAANKKREQPGSDPVDGLGRYADEYGRLPSGWERRMHPDGRKHYYINHITKNTQWARPRMDWSNVTKDDEEAEAFIDNVIEFNTKTRKKSSKSEV